MSPAHGGCPLVHCHTAVCLSVCLLCYDRGVINAAVGTEALMSPAHSGCPLVHRHTAVGHSKAVLSVSASDTHLYTASKGTCFPSYEYFLKPNELCYPAILSMGRILSLLWLYSFSFHYVRLRISQPGFTNQREILHGSSATSQTGLLLFGGDSPRNGRVMGVNRGHLA